MDNKQREPILVVHLQGPGTRNNRILLTDLVALGRQLQTSVDRVARMLAGESVSVRPGRKPEKYVAACALEVVALESGSFALALDLRRDQLQIDGTDIGENAVEKLITGIESIAGDAESLPPGYDPGVLLSLRESGTLFERGIDHLEFHLNTRHKKQVVTYDRQTYNRIVQRIEEPIQNLRTIEGRLLMADFKETGLRCRLHPPLGKPIQCIFDEAHREIVLNGLLHYVRVSGEAEIDPATNNIKHLTIGDLEIIDIKSEEVPLDEGITGVEFWQGTDLEDLAEEQGVRPVENFEAILGGWPEDESIEDFLHDLRNWRSEDISEDER